MLAGGTLFAYKSLQIQSHSFIRTHPKLAQSSSTSSENEDPMVRPGLLIILKRLTEKGSFEIARGLSPRMI